MTCTGALSASSLPRNGTRQWPKPVLALKRPQSRKSPRAIVRAPRATSKSSSAALLEISDLNSAGAVLGWDHATYMPKGGATARARQGATLSRLAHEKFVDPALGRLLDALDALRRDAPLRLGRREPDPSGAPRFRQGDQGAGRFCRARQRVRLGVLRCLDAGAPGKRFRDHGARSSSGHSTSAANTPASSRPTRTSPIR